MKERKCAFDTNVFKVERKSDLCEYNKFYEGQVIKTSFFNIAPYAYKAKHRNGMDELILEILSQKYKFKYESQFVKNYAVLIQSVANGSAQLGLSRGSMSYQRHLGVSFTNRMDSR